MKALTSFFGLIPTNDVDTNGAKEFMKGVYNGIATELTLKEMQKYLYDEDLDSCIEG